MADENDSEKSEDPTQKRLDDALERGDVAKSQEVNTWFVLAGATLILLSFSGQMSQSLTTIMRGLIVHAHEIPVDSVGLVRMMQTGGSGPIGAIALPLSLLILAAVTGNMVQPRLVWS